MLNPAKSTTNLATVRKMPLERPAHAGKDWKGVPHGELLTELLKQARTRGLPFELVAVHVGRGGFDMSAGLRLPEASKLPRLRHGWKYGLGLATSNANRYRLRFFVGAWLQQEDETWVSVVAHSFRSEKRYTHQFELGAEVGTALERWAASAGRLRKKLDRLAAHQIDPDVAQSLLVTAATEGLTPPSRAIRALQDVQKIEKPSSLDVLVAFGDTAALNPPDVQQDQLLGFFNKVKEHVSPAPKAST